MLQIVLVGSQFSKKKKLVLDFMSGSETHYRNSFIPQVTGEQLLNVPRLKELLAHALHSLGGTFEGVRSFKTSVWCVCLQLQPMAERKSQKNFSTKSQGTGSFCVGFLSAYRSKF